MKLILVTALLLGRLFGFCQDTNSFTEEFFGKGKICSSQLNPSTSFKRFHNDLKSLLRLDEVVSMKVTALCSDKMVQIVQKDTIVYLSPGILQTKYSAKVSAMVLDTIYSLAMNPNLSMQYVRELHNFLKPGRIFVLNGDTLSIISMNSCANAAKFFRIVDAIRKDHQFDRLFVVMCGVDQRDMRLYK